MINGFLAQKDMEKKGVVGHLNFFILVVKKTLGFLRSRTQFSLLNHGQFRISLLFG